MPGAALPPGSRVPARCPRSSPRQPPKGGRGAPPAAAPGSRGRRCHFVPPTHTRLPDPRRRGPLAGRGPAVPPAAPAGPGAQPRAPTATRAPPPAAPRSLRAAPPSAAPSSRRMRPGHPAARRAAPPPGPAPPPRAGRRPPPASASAAPAAAINLPGRGRRRPCPPIGGRLRRGAAAPGAPRHPFVFELTPACRDSASPPDRAAGAFNSRRSAYPAAPARPGPPAPIGCAPPRGARPSALIGCRRRRNLAVHFLF